MHGLLCCSWLFAGNLILSARSTVADHVLRLSLPSVKYFAFVHRKTFLLRNSIRKLLSAHYSTIVIFISPVQKYCIHYTVHFSRTTHFSPINIPCVCVYHNNRCEYEILNSFRKAEQKSVRRTKFAMKYNIMARETDREREKYTTIEWDTILHYYRSESLFEKYLLLAGSRAQNSSPCTHNFHYFPSLYVRWYTLFIRLYFN